MAIQNSTSWIKDGEKYALVGLSLKLEGQLSSGPIATNLSVLVDAKFSVPAKGADFGRQSCVQFHGSHPS